MPQGSKDKDPIAEAASRERRIMDALGNAQVEALVGVVAPSGSSAVRFPPSKDWIVKFELLHWHLVDGSVADGPIQIRKIVNDPQQRESLMARLKPLDLVALSAGLLHDAELGGFQGHLVHLDEKPVSDPRLEQLRASLLEPITREHSRFGTLVFDRQLEWFEADTVWQSQQIKLILSAQADQLATTLDVAERLFASQDSWQRTVTGFGADGLLKLKNAEWREADEPRLTTENFIACMALESITVFEDGALEFHFDDGDLFLGHTIIVSASIENGPESAYIAG